MEGWWHRGSIWQSTLRILSCSGSKKAEKGLILVRESCNESSSTRWGILEDCYRHGYGVEQNFNTAVFYYNRAIAVNRGIGALVLAHVALGEMKKEGQGIRNIKHGSHYYYLYAADRFYTSAQWKVGQMLETGKGV